MTDPTLPAPETAVQPTRRPRAGLWLGLGAGSVLAAGMAAGGWAWQTEAGTRWLLGQVPGLSTQGLAGALGSGSMQLDELRWQGAAGELKLTGLRWSGMAWLWRPHTGAWAGLQLQALNVQAATWQSAPSTSPTAAPADLVLPAILSIEELQVDRLQVDALPLIEDLRASVHLGAEGGTRHQIDRLQARTDRYQLQGSASIEAQGPMALTLNAQLQGNTANRPWQAKLIGQGPLLHWQATADLSGEPARAGQPAPALQAKATVMPFEAWPLGDLQLNTTALDLSSLDARAPETRLDSEISLQAAGLNQPAKAVITLRNALPGSWDQHRAPVSRVQAKVAGTPMPLNRLQLDELLLELNDGRQAAGRISGSGQWQRDSATDLALVLQQVQPALLDRRAPTMQLSGPVALELLPGAGSAEPTLKVKSQLDGRSTFISPGAAQHDIQLRIDAEGNRLGVKLTDFTARAGAASTRWQGTVQRDAQRWRWQLTGDLSQFDPAVWWPGEAGSAWRKGPHRLDARVESAASLPAAALERAGLPDLAQVAGNINLTIAPSQLAGVPVQAQLQLTGSGDGTAQWKGSGSVADAQWNSSATLAADTRWSLDAKVPRIAGMAPVLALVPHSAAWMPQGGQLQLNASGQGAAEQHRWQLDGRVAELRSPQLALKDATVSARGGLTADAPLQLILKGGIASGAGWALRSSQLEVSGSVRNHRLSAQLDSPARPPAWFEHWLGTSTGSGSRLSAALDGRWTPAALAVPATSAKAPASPKIQLAGTWQGQLTQLRGGAADGTGQAWAEARDIGLGLSLDANGQITDMRLNPGRLALPGTGLRWQQAQWRARPGQPLPELNLDMELEAFMLAPWLARAQPELGWSGDLTLAGSVRVRSGQRLDADIVFERRSGDLSVADDNLDPRSRSQPLGLTDLRLGLSAHDGVWHFTQGLAGKALGAIGGVATVRTRADALWPEATAPLDGSLQLRVANLGAWGAWVPPGWRLGGEVRSSATLGGRFGSPEFTGSLTGERISARHVLNGLQLSDGDIAIQLNGAHAIVERFRFKGGEGQLEVTGDARFGEQPGAQLNLKADRFLTLGRVDRRLVTSGQAQLKLTADQLRLDGQLKVDEGLIDFSRGDAPGLDDDVSIVTAQAGSTPTEPANRANPRPTVLAVTLDLGEQLRVKGRGLDTRLRGQLKITNPGNKLAVHGNVQTDRGTYAAYGQKLEIERGVLSFVGPVEDPRLDIFAVRPNLDISVGVAVTGTALNPRVRLASDTDLSDTDKLSWLVLGRASDGLGSADTALLQRAAMALLAGEGEAPTDAVLKAIGLTDFSLRQTTDGDVRATVVSVGKQLSRRWYVGYERSVNATSGTWQLIYRAAQRFTLRAQSGDDSALDLIWTWRWN